MTQISSYGAIFLVLLLLIALGYRWLRQRTSGGMASAVSATKVVSAVAVGPQQRVVTVEAGPQGQRTWLVLGVTPQAVNCLHRFVIEPEAGDSAAMPAVSGEPGGPAHGA